MQRIKGYIFIPEFSYTKYRPIFGPNTENTEKRSYANLNTNNLSVFSEKNQAEQSAEDYKKNFKDIAKIEYGYLELVIAESIEEVNFFEDKENLIMITKPLKTGECPNHSLNGPIMNKEHRSVLPFQELNTNGFIPYTFANSCGLTPYQRADYAAREANRQGQVPATIAQFSLKML